MTIDLTKLRAFWTPSRRMALRRDGLGVIRAADDLRRLMDELDAAYAEIAALKKRQPRKAEE